MIVDDEPFLARAIKERLALEGFEVAVAADGLAGLAAADEFSPDLILLDLLMPKMDGMAMLKKLRQGGRGKKTPVIILSNLNNDQARRDSLAAGANDFMTKINASLEDIAAVTKKQLKN